MRNDDNDVNGIAPPTISQLPLISDFLKLQFSLFSCKSRGRKRARATESSNTPWLRIRYILHTYTQYPRAVGSYTSSLLYSREQWTSLPIISTCLSINALGQERAINLANELVLGAAARFAEFCFFFCFLTSIAFLRKAVFFFSRSGKTFRERTHSS